MVVIKHQHAAPLLKEAIVLDLGDVGRQASRLMAVAKEKAQKMLHDAQERANEITAQAQSQGHNQGYEEGLAKGLAEGSAKGLEQGRQQAYDELLPRLAQVEQVWRDALAQWESQQAGLHQDARESVLELALRLTEKIVHRVVQVDPMVVVDQIGAALVHVMDASEVVIRIHPSERQVAEEHLPQLMAEFNHLTHARLVDDDSVSPGGCVVNCGRGSIDATLDVQLARAVDLLLPQGEAGDAGDVHDAGALAAGIDQDVSLMDQTPSQEGLSSSGEASSPATE